MVTNKDTHISFMQMWHLPKMPTKLTDGDKFLTPVKLLNLAAIFYRHPMRLQYATPEIRDDPTIALAAVISCRSAAQFISARLRKNVEFIRNLSIVLDVHISKISTIITFTAEEPIYN